MVKFGGLGDVVQAFGPLRRIRQAHPEAELEVLTTPAFAPLFAASGLADRVWDDGRPRRLRDTLAMLRRLRRRRYDRVYDLQTSDRSSALRLALLPRPPEWSGIAPGASHPHRDRDRDTMHTLERQAAQLRDAGIWPDAPTAPGSAPAPDLAFMAGRADIAGLAPPEPYVLLAPGAAPHRTGKRWPVAAYVALARAFAAEGLRVAVVGGPGEREIGAEIAATPGAADLTDRTDLAQLAALGPRAALAVGNDTGPVHLLAAAGAPTLVLFGPESDPALCAPRGRVVRVLRADPLAALAPEEVLAAARNLLTAAPRLIGAAPDPI